MVPTWATKTRPCHTLILCKANSTRPPGHDGNKSIRPRVGHTTTTTNNKPCSQSVGHNRPIIGTNTHSALCDTNIYTTIERSSHTHKSSISHDKCRVLVRLYQSASVNVTRLIPSADRQPTPAYKVRESNWIGQGRNKKKGVPRLVLGPRQMVHFNGLYKYILV